MGQPGQGPRPRGVSLIESAVTLAVLSIIVAAAAPSFGESLERRRVRGHAETLEADIHFARSEALARSQSLRLSFASDAAGSCYVLHTGSCRCHGDGVNECDEGGAPVKSAHLARGEGRLDSNVRSMLFDPARNTVTPTGTVRVIGPGGHELRQIVNLTGRVRTCTPDGSMPGHRRC